MSKSHKGQRTRPYHICSEEELFLWLMNRLAEKGGLLRVDALVYGKAWQFVSQLSSGRAIEKPLITSVDVVNVRARVLDRPSDFSIGLALLRYLAFVGDMMLSCSQPHAIALNRLVPAARWLWDSNEKYIISNYDDADIILESTDLATSKFDVSINVNVTALDFRSIGFIM